MSSCFVIVLHRDADHLVICASIILVTSCLTGSGSVTFYSTFVSVKSTQPVWDYSLTVAGYFSIRQDPGKERGSGRTLTSLMNTTAECINSS